MRYHALASDYDGTLAAQGLLDEPTRAAVERLRASGRKLLLVTGRRLDDLERVCPDLTIFDSIVAENGAVVYRPASRETRLLAPAPPAAFVQALRARGVDPIDVGHVIVATWRPHEVVVLDVIRSLGLELQVIFNKGAVMVLPSGVNKASGLDAALAELGLSPHNVVGVGDAENDHAFLARCECAVAVDNAIPSLKEHADWVTAGQRGAGVTELIEGLLADDLARLGPRLGRHDILLGQDEDGRDVGLPAYGSSVLIAGTSGGGKSSIVTGLIERMAENRYQHCIIDPEGDYSTYAGAVVLADAKRAPTVDEVIDVLGAPERNLVVNLLGLPLEERPLFATALLPRLWELRARFGRPAWIVLDETHHLLPESWQAADLALLEQLHGLLLVTVHPQHVSAVVLRAVDLVLAIGREPRDVLRTFAAALSVAPPEIGHPELEPGEAIAWWPRTDRSPVRVRTVPGRSERKRHARKYAEGDLGVDKSFFFRGPDGRLNLRAQNLHLFLQLADGVDRETWLHHLRRRDYSGWIRESIKDDTLADQIAAIEAAAADRDGRSDDASDGALADETRSRVRAAIEARYTAPA
jgi:hydroxymethylpyrimidine pyrophosphatase-like HAD family hydrolase